MALLSDYVTGSITVTNGSVDFTGTGTAWRLANIREGDTLQLQNLTAVIAANSPTDPLIISNTAGKFTTAWTGASGTFSTYRIRYMPDGARVTAETRTLIEILGNGNVSALAGLTSGPDLLPFFNGIGTMSTTGFTAIGRSLVGSTNAGDIRDSIDAVAHALNAADLKALDTSKDKVCVTYAEGGKNGVWRWILGDFTTLVALDPLEGLYRKANAVAVTVGCWVRDHDGEMLPEWWGAIGDKVTNDGAALNAAGAFGWPIKLTKLYATTSSVSFTNKAISISGVGQYISGILDLGLGENVYALSIINADYTTPVTLRDFSILTDQSTISRGLRVQFGVFDSEFNRLPFRLLIENMEIRGRPVDVNGRLTRGFAVGATLRNIIRPQISNVTIAGRGDGLTQANNTYMSIGWELLSDYHATDPYQRAAPTDPVFRDCHVYSSDKGWSVDGHWEGIIWDHCVAVMVNYGIFAEANNPPGTGGIQYPWIDISAFHCNFFNEGIHIKEYFDVKIRQPILYKWSPAVAAFVSTGINLNNVPRFEIDGANLVNLTLGIDNQQLNGIFINNCLGGTIRMPQFSGVSNGVILAGATTNVTYERGLWRDLPGFGPTPIEYQDSSSGANRMLHVPFDVTGSNVAIVTVTTSSTTVFSHNIGTVYAGDEFILEYFVSLAKDATASPVSYILSKSAGTSGVLFYGAQGFSTDSLYALAGLSQSKSGTIRAKITSSGTCTFALECQNVAGNGTIAVGSGILRVVRVN